MPRKQRGNYVKNMLRNLLKVTRRATKEEKPATGSPKPPKVEKSARSLARNATAVAEREELLSGSRRQNTRKLRIRAPNTSDTRKWYEAFRNDPHGLQQELQSKQYQVRQLLKDSRYELISITAPNPVGEYYKNSYGNGSVNYTTYSAIVPKEPQKTFKRRSVEEWIAMSTEEPEEFDELIEEFQGDRDDYIHFLAFLKQNRVDTPSDGLRFILKRKAD